MATKTETNLTELKINYLSEDAYNTALAAGEINEDEIYMTPTDSGVGDPVAITINSSNFTGSCYIRKIGNNFCEIFNSVNANNISTLYTNTTIPAYRNLVLTDSNINSEFRPTNDAYIPVLLLSSSNKSYPGIVFIRNDGQIAIYNCSAVEIPSNSWVNIGGVYSIA